MKNLKPLENILRNAKLKITPSRIIILQVLTETKKEMTAFEIEQKLISLKHQIYITNIYTILRVFEKNNIIQRFKIGDGQAYFSLKDHTNIIRFLCKFCGQQQSSHNLDLHPIFFDICKKEGLELKAYSLILSTQCKACLSKN